MSTRLGRSDLLPKSLQYIILMMQPYPLLILFLQRGGRVVGHGKIMQEKIILGDSEFDLFFRSFCMPFDRKRVCWVLHSNTKTCSDERNFREITVVIKLNECTLYITWRTFLFPLPSSFSNSFIALRKLF